MLTRRPHPGGFHDESSGSAVSRGFETVAEIMVRTTLGILDKGDRERLVAAAYEKPYTVPEDLLSACEGMVDSEGRLSRDIQEALKRNPDHE